MKHLCYASNIDIKDTKLPRLETKEQQQKKTYKLFQKLWSMLVHTQSISLFSTAHTFMWVSTKGEKKIRAVRARTAL